MDEATFTAFYERTARSLRSYLARSTGSLSAADDLMQESYYRFLRSGFSTDDDEYRKNYLFRIGTNLVKDHFRRRREVQSEKVIGFESGHEDRVHLRSDVGGALTELKCRDRQMLWLAYVEGSSHSEIAQILGLQTASIRSMLFRARQRLAALLRERGLEPGKEKVT